MEPRLRLRKAKEWRLKRKKRRRLSRRETYRETSPSRAVCQIFEEDQRERLFVGEQAAAAALVIGELEKGRPRPTLYKDEEKKGPAEPRGVREEDEACRVGRNEPDATERKRPWAEGMSEAEMLLCSIPRDQARPTSCPIGFILRRVKPAGRQSCRTASTSGLGGLRQVVADSFDH